MSENKDNNYNDTNKKEDPLAGKNKVCGMVAIPGDLYQSSIVCTACPHCNKVGPTKVDSTWSMKSYLCCYCCGPCWWCWQTVKGKDYTLKNGHHSCSSCNQSLQHYEAC